MECIECGRKDSVPYKCPRCLSAKYCSVACYKLHSQNACSSNTIIDKDIKEQEKEDEDDEEGQIEQTNDRHMAALKTNKEIGEWMANNRALVESMITCADPVLSVQRSRRNNKSFNRISKLILDIIQ